MSAVRIDIPKRGSACHRCSLQFSSGKTLISRLCLNNKGEIYRFDSCCECQEHSSMEKGEISSWKTTVPNEKKTFGVKQKEEIAKETFENLVREGNGPPAKIYLLALYLERRRLLVRRGALQEDGADVLFFESVQTGDLYPVPLMSVNQIELNEIGEDLKNIF